MSSTHHKSTRSRYSSPLQPNTPSGHSRGLIMEGQRTFMQRWLEPPVQNKASFQEAGLIRGGVVENMAPLGTLPKSAMYKKSPVNGDGLPAPAPAPAPAPVKTRIVLKKPYATTTTTTPTLTPTHRESAPRIREQSMDEVEAEVGAAPLSPLSQPLAAPTTMDDGEDEDYIPKKSKIRTSQQQSEHTTPSNNRRHSARRRSARPSPTPVVITVPAISTPAQSSPVQAPVPAPSPQPAPGFRAPAALLNRVPDKELADKVVEAAVDEALRHYRYPTAWALRLLYDENSSDPHFVSMIEDIFLQRADVETIKEFNRLVSEKKKDGKKDNKGCYYFVPPSTGSRFTPHKPKPAPYSELVKMDFSHFPDDTSEGPVNKKLKLDEGVKDTPAKDAQDDEGTRDAQHAQDFVIDAASPSKVNGDGDHKGLTSSKSPQKTHHKSPSKGRKMRSGSVSSSSSLSSVPDDVPDDYEDFMDQVDDDLNGVRPLPAAPEANDSQIPVDSDQPISIEETKPASKKKHGVPPNGTPTPSTRQHSSRDSSMSTTVVLNGLTHQQQTPKRQQTPSIKFTSKYGDADLAEPLVQKKLNNKLEIRSATEDIVEESFIREPLLDESLPFELAIPPPPTTEQYRSSRTPALSSRAARAAKRNHDELDDSISPTTQSFRAAELEMPSARNSRAATPASNLRSSKKPRAGLRVKNSPMKKKGTSAGIPRSAVDRPSPVNFGPPHHQDDNDDSCYTCGGNGELVCCDGCNYSFHFLCIDPPMDEGHMPDEWYCNECKHSGSPPFDGEYQGPFRFLLPILDRKNTRAFRLPEDVRELFEDVRTGPEGEYEEAVPPKPKATKKGVEEAFDFFKVKNADGPVLCFRCHKATSDNRPMIPCSVCGLNWHLECLDPPLAIPPVIRTWRCPCHAEETLAELPARLAPAHRHRKIKNAPVIDHAYSRGMANDGYIEIINDDESDEEAWRKYKGFGRTHRLSAKGVKRDFISRVHETRRRNPAPINAVNAAPAVQPRIRSLEEEQAALNLAQLTRGDGMSLLHQAMISQASPDIVSMMASGDAKRIASGSLSSVDTVSLQTMLAQAESLQQGIRKLLEGRDKPTSENKANTASKAAEKESLSSDNPKCHDSTISKDGKHCAIKDIASNPDAEGKKHAKDESAMQID
ncbi:hypothetical protein F4806DRAFT_490919 [Annulohypoxylon nitens]|nr:hypothetical protein F4806DRAFT_490919 [Annulohypoxylon nitens]